MYLYLISAILLCIVGKVIYDSTRLRLEEHDLTQPISPKTQKPLNILFFSDLHYRYLWIRQKDIVRKLKDRPVDLIIFGGDLGYKDAEDAFQWLKDLHKTLAKMWDKPDLAPILGVWGNHDIKIPRSLSQDERYQFIENEMHAFTHEGTTWTVLGLSDLRTNRQGINELLAANISISDPEHSILIAHNPDTFLLDLPKTRIALAGHYHGGQICLPFHLEFKLLRPNDQLAKEGIIEGLQKVNGHELLISPGIGNTFVPIRFFSQSTIHLIKL